MRSVNGASDVALSYIIFDQTQVSFVSCFGHVVSGSRGAVRCFTQYTEISFMRVFFCCCLSVFFKVLVGSPSRDGDVTGLCLWHNRACPFLFILFLYLCIFVFMALSTVLHSINSPDNSPFFSLCSLDLTGNHEWTRMPHWSFQLYISLWKSPSALV